MMEVQYWKGGSGRSPVEKELLDLSKTDPDDVIGILEQVRRLGREGMKLLVEQPALVKKIRGYPNKLKLFELVVWPYRLPFTTRENIIWILHLFHKQRQRERQELETAAERARRI